MKKNLGMSKKVREVYDEVLIGTWEKLDDIQAQYNHKESRLSGESEQIVNYVNTLPDFDKKVFYLYTEYSSYRKVSYECNVSKDIIMNIIRRIQKDIIDGKHII
jgi:hypothetical protein